MGGARLNAIAICTLAVLAGPAQAGWQDRATAHDVKRIAAIDRARAAALADAARNLPARDLSLVRGVLDRPAQPTSLAALAGKWRCRSIKLGGISPDVIYSWFPCRILVKDGVARFEKHTGSQYFTGTLYPHKTGSFVLLAGMNVAGEPIAHYSGRGPHLGAHTTPSDVAGLLTYTGGRTARIEFAMPAQESDFDVIEMKR